MAENNTHLFSYISGGQKSNMVSQDRVNVSVALVASGGSKENIFSQFFSVHGGGLHSLARGHLDSLSKYTALVWVSIIAAFFLDSGFSCTPLIRTLWLYPAQVNNPG